MDKKARGAGEGREMKTVMNRQNLEYGLGVIIGAVDKKKIGGYSGSILMRTGLGGVRVELHATDMEMFAEVNLECVGIAVAGDVVLPAEKFLSAIKNCGDGDVIVSAAEFNAVIEGSAVEYCINGLDPVDYPFGITDGEQENLLNFPPRSLVDCMKAVKHAACADLSKPNINGINVMITRHESGDGLVTFSATDGHRLSLGTIQLSAEHILEKTQQTFTMPYKSVDLLSGISAGMLVSRVAKQNRLCFETGSISVCINQTTLEYPDVRRVIPSGDGEVITVNSAALIGAIGSVCVMADDSFRSVNIDVTADEITLTALGANNTARAKLPCLSDCAVKIRVNSCYLVQALKALNSEEVFIKHFGGSAPLMLIPADHRAWNERLEIIMPLRGND